MHEKDGEMVPDRASYRVILSLDCPLCSEATEGFASEYNFDQDEQLDELKRTITEKSSPASEKSIQTYWTLNRMAASILFIIVSAALVVYWSAQSNEKNFLAEFQSSKDLIESVRGAGDFPEGSQFTKGLELYRNENYQESLFFFENILV